jgi:hypothetical protein
MNQPSGAYPPIVPQPLASDPRDAVWPGWIGGLSIGFGVLGLFGICCGVAGLGSASALSGITGSEPVPPPTLIVVPTLVGGMIGAAFSIMLLVGGINTLRRRPGGPRMLRNYAIAAIAFAFVNIPLTALSVPAGSQWGADIAMAQLDALEKKGTAVTQQQRDEVEAMREPNALSYAWALGLAGIGLAYPVVLLVFLRKPAVRAQCDSWQG